MKKNEQIKSNGWSSDYYILPKNVKELQDIIEETGMTWNIANIFKSCYRLGRKAGNDILYDLNKIKWFVTREINKYKRDNGIAITWQEELAEQVLNIPDINDYEITPIIKLIPYRDEIDFRLRYKIEKYYGESVNIYDYQPNNKGNEQILNCDAYENNLRARDNWEEKHKDVEILRKKLQDEYSKDDHMAWENRKL